MALKRNQGCKRCDYDLRVSLAVIKNVDFHCEANNTAHRTIEITAKQLIVRRGQSFLLTLEMMQPFQANEPLVLTVETGTYICCFTLNFVSKQGGTLC